MLDKKKIFYFRGTLLKSCWSITPTKRPSAGEIGKYALLLHHLPARLVSDPANLPSAGDIGKFARYSAICR